MRDAVGAAPAVGAGLAIERAVAGEGELAACRPGRTLEYDAADRAGESYVPNAVEHDLCDGALAVVVLASRLIIDCVGKALERLRTGSRAALEDEGLGRGVGPAGQRYVLVHLHCLLGGKLTDEKRRRRRRSDA